MHQSRWSLGPECHGQGMPYRFSTSGCDCHWPRGTPHPQCHPPTPSITPYTHPAAATDPTPLPIFSSRPPTCTMLRPRPKPPYLREMLMSTCANGREREMRVREAERVREGGWWWQGSAGPQVKGRSGSTQHRHQHHLHLASQATPKCQPRMHAAAAAAPQYPSPERR